MSERKSGIPEAALAAVGAVAAVTTAHAAELDPALQKILTYKFGDSREPLTAVQDLARTSSGEQRLALERQFAAILGMPDATYEAKDFSCRQIWRIGTKESIPALAPLLTDEKYSDMARYALERNTAPEAGKAIRDALSQAAGKSLIGLINTLGARRDALAVAALEKFAAAADEAPAAAALAALGKIGGPKAGVILARVKTTGAPALQKAAATALQVMTMKSATLKK